MSEPRTGTLAIENLLVTVLILEEKRAYGNRRLLVTPLEGSESQWVSADRVFDEGAPKEVQA